MEATAASPIALHRPRSVEFQPAFIAVEARRPSAPSLRSHIDASMGYGSWIPQRTCSSADVNAGFVTHVDPARPATPVSPPSEAIDPQTPSALTFHNYLRALHPFDPASGAVSGEDASLLTASMKPGDLILVHCVHANGWADGTVLNTGDRGWLPTNYCEAYDHPHLRTLLSALIQFWDLLGANEDANLSTFVRQDYIRGIIAGVRYLLEHADCLHRDAELVKRHVGVRRMRKGLLADLSSLVQIAKRLQETISEPFASEVIHVLLEDLVTKAFKVITRAVSFIDVWSQEAGAVRNILKRQIVAADRPATPPADGAVLLVNVSASPSKLTADRPIDSAKCFDDSSSVERHEPQHSHPQDDAPKRKSAIFTPPEGVVLHRLSHIAKKLPPTPCAVLASEQLAKVHDICISHIGAFIGHQLHSRPGSELVATTQKLVHACQNMLAIVDEVCSHDPQGCAAVQSARHEFEQKLDDLVKSTNEIFNASDPSEDDVVVLPIQNSHLINVGTGLIRNSGECVVKTRQLIEKCGDFELKTLPTVQSPVSPSKGDAHGFVEPAPTEEPCSPRVSIQARNSIERYPSKQALPLPPPPPPATLLPPTSAVAAEFCLPSPADTLDLVTPITPATPALQQSASSSSMPPPPPPTVREPRSTARNSQASSVRIEVAESLQSAPSVRSQSISPARKDSVGVSVTSSVDTSFSTTHDAESSVSTRATTPEQPKEHHKEPSSPNSAMMSSFASMSSFQSLGTDDTSDAEAQLLQKTYANELTLSKEGQVTGGSLPALVEQLTTHDSAPDPQFVTAFFLTFRKFTEPRDFALALMARYDYIGDSRTIGFPVRLRIFNVFKGWLETYWHGEADREALGEIRYFALHKLKHHLPAASERLIELTRRVTAAYSNGTILGPLVSGVGKTSMSMSSQRDNQTNTPEPLVSKSQLNALRVATGGGSPYNIVDLDALELARQLTLIAMKTYCQIQPDELLSMDWNKANTKKARNVRAMCMLNTDLAHVVGDTILGPDDPKKRAQVIKQWAKVATHCLELNNYDTIMAIMCSINSSVVRRLKRTWELVSKKTRARLEELDHVIDIRKNYSSLRRRLETPSAPCLPFLGVYLTDLTFVIAGNPKRRELPGSASANGEPVSVINFDMYMRLAKIICHLQKYQVPYKLRSVPEMQTWIESHMSRMREGQEQMVSTLHRRSIMIEPRVESNVNRRPQITLDTKHVDNNIPVPVQALAPTSAKSETPAVLDRFDFFFKSGPFTLKSISSRQDLQTIDEAQSAN